MSWIAVFAIGDAHVRVTRVSGKRSEEMGEIEATGWSAQRIAIEHLLIDGRLRACREAAIELSGRCVQLRTIRDLPVAKQAVTTSMVRNQARRYFRACGGTPLVAAVVDRDEDGEAIVRAACVHREFVEEIEAMLISAGFRVKCVRTIDPQRGWPMEFATQATLSTAKARIARASMGYGAVALFTWLIAGAAYLGDLYRDRQALNVELEALEAPLAQLARIRREVDPVTTTFSDLRAPDENVPWITQRISRIVRLVPRNAYLTGLEIDRSGSVRLEGNTDSLVSFVAGLDAILSVPPRLDSATSVPSGQRGATPFGIEFEIDGQSAR